jgi:hypothetical protein
MMLEPTPAEVSGPRLARSLLPIPLLALAAALLLLYG